MYGCWLRFQKQTAKAGQTKCPVTANTGQNVVQAHPGLEWGI